MNSEIAEGVILGLIFAAVSNTFKFCYWDLATTCLNVKIFSITESRLKECVAAKGNCTADDCLKQTDG
jgi:hypothetical protein